MFSRISPAESRMNLILKNLRAMGRRIKPGPLVMFCALILLPCRPASADLMLHPTRIVFEKNQRAAELELINSGSETATYRISVVNRRMNDTGAFSAIDNPLPGEQFAGAMLRFSPRQVALAPGKAQIVRIMLRKPADLRPGEYRSHLQFERIPGSLASAADNQQRRTDGAGISIKLTALVGASIPVIVRHGDTDARVSLSDLVLHKPSRDQPGSLALVLKRSGNRSVYGDLVVSVITKEGVEREIAKAGGVAVYTPNPLRRVMLPFKPLSGQALTQGTVRVVYRQRPEDGGKVLAETAIRL